MGATARSNGIALLLVAMLVAAGCAARTPAEEPDPNGTLTTVITSEPTLDPQLASGTYDVANVMMVFEPLLRLDAATLRPAPGAAKSLPDISADGLTYTLTIRDDSKYSDGSIVRAADFVYAITRLCDPAIKAYYASVAYVIAGCGEWGQLDPKKDPPEKLRAAKEELTTSGVRATGDKELTIKLTKPAAYFSSVLSLWTFSPVRESDVSHGGDQWTEPATYIGNGPFVLSTWKHSERLIFGPNRYYRTPPKLKKWSKLIVVEPAVALNAYRHDEIDALTYGNIGTLLRDVQADPALKAEVVTRPNLCSYAYVFNTRRAPFDDTNVRLAFAKALDREAYVRDVFGGVGAPSTSWIPPGIPGYDKADDTQRFDPNEAARLLASSRYAGSDALRSIVFPANLQAASLTRANWARDQWKAHLGVDVRVQQMDGPTMYQLYRKTETIPQVSFLGWCTDYPDQQDWLSLLFRSDSQTSFERWTQYADPAFDELVDQADRERDQARRDDLYKRAARMLSGSGAVAAVASGGSVSLRKPWVRGVVDTPLDWELGGIAGMEKIFVAKH